MNIVAQKYLPNFFDSVLNRFVRSIEPTQRDMNVSDQYVNKIKSAEQELKRRAGSKKYNCATYDV
ncbi:MAG: hypothetical protein GKR97_12920 [Rhizobiaceae bacterium]|nr:hypothetical protein [Rhizobiaceae bacterium]